MKALLEDILGQCLEVEREEFVDDLPLPLLFLIGKLGTSGKQPGSHQWFMARQWKRKSIGRDGVDTTCSGPEDVVVSQGFDRPSKMKGLGVVPRYMVPRCPCSVDDAIDVIESQVHPDNT